MESIWQQARSQCQLGIQAMSLPVDARQLDQLIGYLQIMQKWNQSYNLTAVRDPLQAVHRHLLDSLSISNWLSAGTCMDAGAGAGLPGIPLAIIEPARRWLLLDSNGKKVRFLRHVQRQLQLHNVQVLQQRLEQLQPADVVADWRPEQIVSRALAPLSRQCAWAQPWLAQGCRLLAMLGEYPQAEIARLPAGVEIIRQVDLRHSGFVPAGRGQRHLLIIAQSR